MRAATAEQILRLPDGGFVTGTEFRLYRLDATTMGWVHHATRLSLSEIEEIARGVRKATARYATAGLRVVEVVTVETVVTSREV